MTPGFAFGCLLNFLKLFHNLFFLKHLVQIHTKEKQVFNNLKQVTHTDNNPKLRVKTTLLFCSLQTEFFFRNSINKYVAFKEISISKIL